MKNIFNSSLQKKFILIVTILLFVVLLISAYVTVVSNIKQTRKNLTEEAISFANLSTKPLGQNYDLYFNSGYFKFREVFTEILKLNLNIKEIQFIDVSGKIIFDSKYVGGSNYQETEDNIVDKTTLDHVLSDKPVYINNPNQSSEITEIYYPYFTDWGSHAYTARYFISYDQVRQNIISIITQAAMLLIIFLIIAVLLISVSVNKLILSPISIVSEMAHKISEGKYGRRIQIKTNDEIEVLAESTNKMARTLEQNIIDLKELDKLKDEFIDIAAGSLKVPLNHLKFDVKYLLDNGKFETKEHELLTDITVNTNKLQLLSDDLIDVTAISKDSTSNIFMPLDLTEVLKESINEVGISLKSKKIKLKASLLKTAPILGDYQKIKMLFVNIIDNAVKFSTEKDGTVEINLIEKGNSYLTEVIDQGIGIDEKEIPKLFQKFYRAPSSAVLNKEGSGLGLYLSKLICDLHHGSIWVESKKGEGSKFYVSFFKKDTFRQTYIK